MILADTSVWIDHLHRTDARLVTLLGDDEIGSHPLVIEELALGRIKDRTVVLALLADLASFPVLDHAELMAMVSRKQLWGRGLSAVDAHLLGSVALLPGAKMWTRDKRLNIAAGEAGIATVS